MIRLLLLLLVCFLMLGIGMLLLREFARCVSARWLARSAAAMGLLLAICVGCAFDVSEIPGLPADSERPTPPSLSQLEQEINRPKVILAVHEGLPAVESAEETPSASDQNGQDASRPTWVDQPPRRVGHVDRFVVSAGPWDTVGACREAIRDEFQNAVRRYLEEEFAVGPVSPEVVQRLNLSPGYIRRELCTEEYVETRETGVGPMKQLHVLMEIDAADRQELARRWRAHERSSNLLVIGSISGGVLGLLGVVWSLFQIDTWTKGYYTKRLFVGVPLVLLLALLALLLE